jgi:hypothetical protein
MGFFEMIWLGLQAVGAIWVVLMILGVVNVLLGTPGFRAKR